MKRNVKMAIISVLKNVVLFGSGETIELLDRMFQLSAVSAEFQLSWVSLAVKGNIKLPPISTMEPVSYWPGPRLVNHGPQCPSLNGKRKIFCLCGKVLVMQIYQSAVAAGGFTCQERPTKRVHFRCLIGNSVAISWRV